MSALTKPQNTFTAGVSAPPVPAELVRHYEAVTFPSQGIGKPAQYFIYFYLISDKTGQFPVKVKFASSSARNTTLGNYNTANATAIS